MQQLWPTNHNRIGLLKEPHTKGTRAVPPESHSRAWSKNHFKAVYTSFCWILVIQYRKMTSKLYFNIRAEGSPLVGIPGLDA